ncbi:MAG: hypothetical protein ACWGOX_06495, partial [Desulforhopalus sp.]
IGRIAPAQFCVLAPLNASLDVSLDDPELIVVDTDGIVYKFGEARHDNPAVSCVAHCFNLLVEIARIYLACNIIPVHVSPDDEPFQVIPGEIVA